MSKSLYFVVLFLIVFLVCGAFIYGVYTDTNNIKKGLEQCVVVDENSVNVVWASSCD